MRDDLGHRQLTSASDPRPARVAVAVQFLLMGATTGSWAARIPDVRRQLGGMTDADWGLAATSSTAGSLVSLTLTLLLVARWGPRRMSLAGAVLLVTNAPLLAAAHSPVHLVLGLLVQGVATGLLGPGINAQAVEVERAYGRRIMSSFHACFSAGQLLGGLAGVLATALGVGPAAQLTVSGVVLLALLGGSFRRAPADRAPAPRPAGGPKRRLPRQLLLLTGIAFCASVNEGSAVQWSAQYTAGTLAAPALGAATFAAFSVAMVASRTVGDRLVNRLGQRRFVRVSEAVVAVGFAAGLLVGTPWAAMAGFALLGLGSACIVPTVMGLAGNQPGLAAGRGVATVSLGQWPAFLLAPPLVGGLAGLLGLRVALGLVVVSATVIAVAGRWIRPTLVGGVSFPRAGTGSAGTRSSAGMAATEAGPAGAALVTAEN